MSRKYKKNRKAPATANPRAAAAPASANRTTTPEPAAALLHQAAPSLAATVTAPSVLSLKEVLLEQTRACIDAHDWARLGELAQQPLDQYSLRDRDSVREQLLYMQMLARIKGQVGSHFVFLQGETRKQIRDLVRQFEALRNEPLHHLGTVFHIYLNSTGHDIASQVETVKHLAVACLERADIHWLRELRRHALRLTSDWQASRPDLSDADKKLVQDLPDLQLLLSQAYASAANDAQLSHKDRLLVQVFKAELDMLMAEPWDYEVVAERISKIPSPSAQGLAELATSGARQMANPLTPRAWALLWTLHNAAPAGRARALSTFSEPDPCAGAEGVRLLAQSTLLPAESAQVDALVVQAATQLAKANEDVLPSWREWIAVQVPTGPVELYVGWLNLECPDFSQVLLKLYESLPAGYPRAAEMRAIHRIIWVRESFSELQADEPDNSDSMPGLQWLCERSPRFAVMAACTIYGGAARLRLLLGALDKWGAVEGAFPPKLPHFYAHDDRVQTAESEDLVTTLERIGANRTALTNEASQVLQAMLDATLQYLCEVPSLAKRLLAVCRMFVDELYLTDHGCGRYAQVCFLNGMTVAGVQLCITYWSSGLQLTYEEMLEAAVRSTQSLADVAELRKLTELLQPHQALEPAARLLGVVTKRLAEVDKQDQFLRTGVDRWPALKPLTRKLLVVLSKVSRYDSLAELGQYAGIDANWVKWHYDRLVESGMLLVEGGSYTINPYVKPLLERESQHAVVGRIVRASGTSAIKQVFNSQREFGIYQVMVQLCPNHLVMPNCSLQSIISYERIKELVDAEDFSYYLKASVDLVVASTTTYLPMLAVEVDSVWHDTDKQTVRDERKDRIFAAAGIPLLRLRPVGDPSPAVIHGEVGSHFQELMTSLRQDLPGFEQARSLLEELGKQTSTPVAR